MERKLMRVPFVIVALVGLAACNPVVPDSGEGVGFQDYNTYLRDRTSQAGTASGPASPATGFSADAAAAAIDRADGGGAPSGADPAATGAGSVPTGAIIGDPSARPRGDAPAGIRTESGEMVHSTGTVSDEQDFNAVSARETIESDKARIERNRAQYTVIQPGALPVRPGDTGPNIVAYALATNNVPGVQLYARSKLRSGNSGAACGRFGSPDVAQEAFLANGGPERDRKGLDPDGDGFACSWDPRPFRTALQ